jgi:hypothetical protein
MDGAVHRRRWKNLARGPEKMQAGTSALQPFFAPVRARNTESVGPLRREELYDRSLLR